MESDIPGFEVALARFREFLCSLGYSGELVWVFREDLFRPAPDRGVTVQPAPKRNRGLAESLFEQGRARGLCSGHIRVRLLRGRRWSTRAGELAMPRMSFLQRALRRSDVTVVMKYLVARIVARTAEVGRLTHRCSGRARSFHPPVRAAELKVR